MRTARPDHHEDRRPKGLLAVISGAIAVGVVATVLGIWNAAGLARESDLRERERISADLASCERGNLLRGQVVEIGRAGEELVADVLEVVFAFSSDADRVEALRVELAPVFAEHRAAVDTIALVDCAGALRDPSSSTSLPPTPEEPNP